MMAKKSGFYDFLLNMWIMRRIDEEFLDRMVIKGRISKEEEDMILATPQMPERDQIKFQSLF